MAAGECGAVASVGIPTAVGRKDGQTYVSSDLATAPAALVAAALDSAGPPYLARLAAALGGPQKASPAMAGLMAARDAFSAGVGRPALLAVLGLEGEVE